MVLSADDNKVLMGLSAEEIERLKAQYVNVQVRSKPCVLKVLGWALYRTKVFGAPKFFIGMEGGLHIYDVAYSDAEMLELCKKLAKRKRLTPKQAKENVGFGVFDNGAGLRFYMSLRPLKTADILLRNWYNMPYSPDPTFDKETAKS